MPFKNAHHHFRERGGPSFAQNERERERDVERDVERENRVCCGVLASPRFARRIASRVGDVQAVGRDVDVLSERREERFHGETVAADYLVRLGEVDVVRRPLRETDALVRRKRRKRRETSFCLPLRRVCDERKSRDAIRDSRSVLACVCV